MRPRECLVIGGGLAGLASAVWLAEAGERVTLVERRAALGGRAHAISVPEVDDVADNGQHVILSGGAPHTMRYLESVGTRRLVKSGPSSTVAPGGKTTVATNAVMLRTALGAAPGAGPRDWWANARGQYRLVRESLRQPPDLDSITIETWFRRLGLRPSALASLWGPITIGVLNEKPEKASAKAFADFIAKLVRTTRGKFVLSYPTVDFDELYVHGAQRVLGERGGRICYRTVVREILVRDGKVAGARLADGSVIDADVVICAVPAWNIGGLLDQVPECNDIYSAAENLSPVPIVSVNLYLDRPIGTTTWNENPIGGEGRLEALFDRQRMHPRDTSNGWLYCLTTSAAYDLAAKTNGDITDISMEMIRRYYPRAADAQVVHSHVVREHRATFTQRPGTAGVRPEQKTSIDGLVLAGDWTKTGWPSTMEGALKSAALAVEAILTAGAAARGPSARAAI